MTTNKKGHAICISDHTSKGEALINFANNTIHKIKIEALPGQTISIEYLEKLVNNLKATLR